MHIKSGNVIIIANPSGNTLHSNRNDNLIARQNEQLCNLENGTKLKLIMNQNYLNNESYNLT